MQESTEVEEIVRYADAGSCSRKKFNALDLPIEGQLTARDARLGVLDCMKQMEASVKAMEDVKRFWEKKIANIRSRCVHENKSENALGTGLLCNDCGAYVKKSE